MSKEPSQPYNMVRWCYIGRRGNNPCWIKKTLKMCPWKRIPF